MNNNIDNTTQMLEDSFTGDGAGGSFMTEENQLASGFPIYGMENSWIKLHRKILENWVFKQRPEYLKIWVYILIAANWKPSKALVNGQFVTIERGEMLTSYRSLAEGAGTTVQIVKTFLKYAENDGMISVKSNTAATRLKILNYEDLQGRENNDQHTPNTRLTHDQHTPNTIIRSKEYKEGKKERIEEEDKDSVSMRSRAFTRPSCQEILDYFIELGSTADEAHKFYDHYTANGWKVGKNAMKDWKATARNWNRNKGKFGKESDPQIAIRTKPAGLPKQVVELYQKELPSEIEIERIKALYLSKVSNNE
jgi:DNA-binding transcriptional regulator YhcF (GntR family)